MPEERQRVAAFADLPQLRPCRLLRRFPNKHATAHFHATAHPVIEGYDPPEGWGWCYVDKVLFDLSKRKTPHNGPIPRFY